MPQEIEHSRRHTIDWHVCGKFSICKLLHYLRKLLLFAFGANKVFWHQIVSIRHHSTSTWGYHVSHKRYFLQWFHVLGRFKANEFQSHEQHTDKHTCSLRRHKIDAPVWFTLGKNINKIIESKMNSNHFHENCYSILRASRVFNWFPHMRSSSARSMACSATRSVDSDNGGVWEKNPTAINRKNDSDAERVRTVKSNLFVATALHFESMRRRWNVPSITQSAGKS